MATHERKLRAAVIGLGRIGWDFHCAQLSTSPLYDLVAACDSDPARCREAEAKFGVRTYASAAELLAAAGAGTAALDVVAIAVPTHLHLDVTLAAIAAGCHVVLEKPAAPTEAEAVRMYAAAREARRLLTLYQPMRCTLAHRTLASAVRAGRLGTLVAVRRYGHSFTRRNDWQSLRKFGGGSLLNTGAHLLDEFVAIWGRDLTVESAVLRRVYTLGDAEDYVHAVLRTPAGLRLEAEVNPASLDPVPAPSWAVYGDRGNFFQRGEHNSFTYLRESELAPRSLNDSTAAAGRKYPGERPPTDAEAFDESPWRNDNPLFYANVHAAITRGEPLITPPEDTLAVMRLLESVRRTAEASPPPI